MKFRGMGVASLYNIGGHIGQSGPQKINKIEDWDFNDFVKTRCIFN
jgi:hypothetical protein